MAVVSLAVGTLASAVSAKAPTDAWTVIRNADPITGASSCVVAATDQIGKSKFTRLGFLYPIVENNSKLGLLIGVSSGGAYRVPTGDILWRVDDNQFHTLKVADNPPTAPMFEVQTPYKTGNPEVDARTAAAMASANRMTAALTATSTVASGPSASGLLKEMLAGRTLIYRQASVAPQYGLPSANTYAVGQLTSDGLRPIPLDESFRRGLRQCSIVPSG
jgi:hypothetical protein